MIEKIVVVTRRTRLEELIARFNTRDQARFYIEHMGGNFAAYQDEHDTYKRAIERLLPKLSPLAKVQVIEREFLPTMLFSDQDMIVTVGLDGLVVNAAKYLDGQPIVAVNPDPSRIDGILLPYGIKTAPAAVAGVLDGRAQVRPITMAEACLNEGQRMLAFNDLFIGVRSHTSARYQISFAGRSEPHSSSGIIVSTGAGSTGWLSSMFHMAAGIARMFGTGDETIDHAIRLDWEAEELVFVVREPFVSKVSQAGIVAGRIQAGEELVLESRTPENGVIFSDGVEADYIGFNSGALAHIRVAEKKTNLVVPDPVSGAPAA